MDENNHVREDLLKKLHGISFCAFLTALTSEMCLEVEVMTSKGTHYCWVGYDEWKVYKLSHSESLKLTGIKELIAEGDLTIEALEGTCFHSLANDGDPNDLIRLFSDYASKDFVPGEDLFCYYDEIEEKFYFFSNEEELGTALNQYYSDVDICWEDMETNDLANWWDRYEFEDGSIPVCFIGDDEE